MKASNMILDHIYTQNLLLILKRLFIQFDYQILPVRKCVIPAAGRTNYPLLFGRDGKPKPAFDAVVGEARAAR